MRPTSTVVLNNGVTRFTNAGAILPPVVTESYEVGLKATIGTNLLLTAALFDMDQPNTFNQPVGPNLFTAEQAGNNLHKGIEITAQGKITPDLTLVGGFTGVDARVTNSYSSTYLNGTMPTDVSPLSGKLFAEYTIPYYDPLSFLHGLTLIGGFQANSWFYGQIDGSGSTLISATKLPGYVVFDTGFRYATAIYEHPLIFRFNVDNVFNTGYWTYGNGNATLSGGVLREGDPRTYMATAEFKW
jgi:iron complex outermembrane recepter protein